MTGYILRHMVAEAQGPSTTNEARPHYSISQAAAQLGVSRVTIWRWIRAGRLPGARLGHRTTRIRREDLERLHLPSVVALDAPPAARAPLLPFDSAAHANERIT